MVRLDGKDFSDGERVSSRQKAPSAKAPLHKVEETPPLGSVWHEARGFETKVDVEVDAQRARKPFQGSTSMYFRAVKDATVDPPAQSVSVPTHLRTRLPACWQHIPS